MKPMRQYLSTQYKSDPDALHKGHKFYRQLFFSVKITREVENPENLTKRQIEAMLKFADDESYQGSVQGHLRGPFKPPIESGECTTQEL